MKWTANPPTQEGYYWFRGSMDLIAVVCFVFRRDGILACWNMGTPLPLTPVDSVIYAGQWYGPITPPENEQ